MARGLGMVSVLPESAIVMAGAGNYTLFVLRHHNFRLPGTLFAPLSAPMGYSVPAGIAAAMIRPDFQQFAMCMGLIARQVQKPEDVAPSYNELRKQTDGPIFVELLTDPAIITPQMKI